MGFNLFGGGVKTSEVEQAILECVRGYLQGGAVELADETIDLVQLDFGGGGGENFILVSGQRSAVATGLRLVATSVALDQGFLCSPVGSTQHLPPLLLAGD